MGGTLSILLAKVFSYSGHFYIKYRCSIDGPDILKVLNVVWFWASKLFRDTKSEKWKLIIHSGNIRKQKQIYYVIGNSMVAYLKIEQFI